MKTRKASEILRSRAKSLRELRVFAMDMRARRLEALAFFAEHGHCWICGAFRCDIMKEDVTRAAFGGES